MTRAYSMRLPEDLLTRAKARAAESGTSFTALIWSNVMFENAMFEGMQLKS